MKSHEGSKRDHPACMEGFGWMQTPINRLYPIKRLTFWAFQFFARWVKSTFTQNTYDSCYNDFLQGISHSFASAYFYLGLQFPKEITYFAGFIVINRLIQQRAWHLTLILFRHNLKLYLFIYYTLPIHDLCHNITTLPVST